MDCGFDFQGAQGPKQIKQDLVGIIFELEVDCGLVFEKCRGSLIRLPERTGIFGAGPLDLNQAAQGDWGGPGGCGGSPKATPVAAARRRWPISAVRASFWTRSGPGGSSWHAQHTWTVGTGLQRLWQCARRWGRIGAVALAGALAFRLRGLGLFANKGCACARC
jgi:hypothetical protein